MYLITSLNIQAFNIIIYFINTHTITMSHDLDTIRAMDIYSINISHPNV